MVDVKELREQILKDLQVIVSTQKKVFKEIKRIKQVDLDDLAEAAKKIIKIKERIDACDRMLAFNNERLRMLNETIAAKLYFTSDERDILKGRTEEE